VSGGTNVNSEIKIFTEKNILSLIINSENTKVTLTINKVKTDEFIVKTENNKLNVYTDVEQEKQEKRQGVKIESVYAYSVLGALVIAALVVVILMGYYGTQSAGIFSPHEAFFVIGAFYTHYVCCIGVPVFNTSEYYQCPQDS